MPSWWEKSQAEYERLVVRAGQDEETACRTKADISTAKFDAEIEKMSKEWRPTGFYRPAEMEKLIQTTHALLLKTSRAIDAAVAVGVQEDIRRNLRAAQGRLQSKMGEATVFAAEIANARGRSASLIDSPYFKAWVIQSQVQVSNALSTIVHTACLKPAAVAALQDVYRASTALIDAAKATVVLAVDAVAGAFSLANWFLKNKGRVAMALFVGATAYVGYRAWRRYGGKGLPRTPTRHALPAGDLEDL